MYSFRKDFRSFGNFGGRRAEVSSYKKMIRELTEKDAMRWEGESVDEIYMEKLIK